jgi:hypothetical protein
MSKNLAADHLLYEAFRFELDQQLNETSCYAIGKSTSLSSENGAIYRIKNEHRIPSIRTIEQTLMSRAPKAARWLTGALRRVMDPASTTNILIGVRDEILARNGASAQQREQWRSAGLATTPGYLARHGNADVLDTLIFELCSLHGSKDLAAATWFVQCWVIRNTLRQLGRCEPAFRLIEVRCTEHVVERLFPPLQNAWRYARTDEFLDDFGMSPWPRFIMPEELIQLYSIDGGRPSKVDAYTRREWYVDDDLPAHDACADYVEESECETYVPAED